jgi:hypothetical protein
MNRPLTCEEITANARDAARALHPSAGEPPDEDLRGRVQEHVRGCAPCAARLERERRLDKQLATLTGAEEPPPDLERRLLRTYRERFSTVELPRPDALEPARATAAPTDSTSQPAHTSSRRRSARALPLVALSALAAAAVVLVYLRLSDPEPAVAVRAPAAPSPATMEERAALPITGGPPDRRPVARFVPLGWDGPARPIEIGRITRVRMPTSIAARFGWPLLPDAPEARVAADVLVGEDGTARALRFLPASFTATETMPDLQE